MEDEMVTTVGVVITEGVDMVVVVAQSESCAFGAIVFIQLLISGIISNHTLSGFFPFLLCQLRTPIAAYLNIPYGQSSEKLPVIMSPFF